MIKNTIFAPASGLIKSGLCVIRISGDKSLWALKQITQISEDLEPRKAYLKTLRDPHTDNIIDEALVLYFKAPFSFTGEDVVEIHCHGSIAVIKNLTEVLSRLDHLRIAEAGEFTRRAFETGKMDLTEVEGLHDLLEAKTQAQHKQAMLQMRGELGKLYSAWRQNLIDLSAHIEALIDFPDEELPLSVTDRIQNEIQDLIKTIANHLNDNKKGQKLRNGISLAILGSPNVGKSSILNRFIGEDIAIVSDIAGTTRDVLESTLDVAGYPINIADTAGIRKQTDDIIEKEGIKRAINKSHDADILFVVIDGTTNNLDDMQDYIQNENAIILINKQDDENFNHKIKSDLSSDLSIEISAKTGQGFPELKDILIAKIKDIAGVSESPIITRERHRSLLHETITALERSQNAPLAEMQAEDIRIAIQSIGSITGKVDIEEVLDSLFAGFCIGK